MLSLFALVLLLVVPSSALASRSVSGYLIYCPCMGRFGNQAEQFLGVLAFARQLRRTLVVPPWISYGRPGAGIDLTPFGRHFNLTKLDAAHPVIDMRQFVDKLSPALWPAGSRAVFCHSAREDGTCQAKVGNPFGPFWDAFGVNFDRDEFYGNTAGSSLGDSESWQRNYPSNRWPVLAFMGAPASFPAQPKHLGLHRHVAFNEEFLESLNLLMEANDLQRPILGVHLRNNVDFSRACGTLLPQLPAGAGLFSSYQCFGPSSHLGQLSMKTCVPDDATILEDVNRLAKSLNIRTVFVATDFDAKLSLMKKAAPEAVKFVSTQTLGTDVFQDVGLLTLADAVLLNCASSLSAFVRRSRDAAGRPSNYLGLAGATGWGHDEL
uniref:GDP-fucose protein O-fucosyltransferase 1 n=2 Tax=Macrostomum lignano TaxID=282301 RepID=A0A1I8GV68_9PLAT